MRKLSLILIPLLINVTVIASTTTFDKKVDSYYGKMASTGKITAVVVPEVNDVNSISSTGTSTDSIHGTLERISIISTGTDTDFTLTVKDQNDITLFEKTDCNTVLLPLTYAFVSADTSGNKHLGIPVTGPLTINTNDVDPNNLTSLTAIIHFREERY